MPEIETWTLEEGCRKSRLGLWRKCAGNQDSDFGGSVPEIEARTLEERCRKAKFVVRLSRSLETSAACSEDHVDVTSSQTRSPDAVGSRTE